MSGILSRRKVNVVGTTVCGLLLAGLLSSCSQSNNEDQGGPPAGGPPPGGPGGMRPAGDRPGGGRKGGPGGEGKVVPIKTRTIDPKAASLVSYAKTIKSLLQQECGGCHGAGAKKAGLDVTSIEGLKAGGREAGPAIIAGKPDESPLVMYIAGTKRPQMPMGGKPLTEDQLHSIREWIQAGAKDDSK